jgi:hypothetical protein
MILRTLDNAVAVSGRRSACEGHVDMTMTAERKAVVQKSTPPAHMVIMGSRRHWVELVALQSEAEESKAQWSCTFFLCDTE